MNRPTAILLPLAMLLGLVLPLSAQTATTVPTTPVALPGAETFIYRDGAEPVRIHVFKPAGWKASDRRPALVYFFGGGWLRGTPENSAGYVRLAARWGMVGIAPDYRVKQRFPTATPVDAVADGRAAVRWVEDHAEELGIDVNRIAVGGNSAGAHLALWTAISKPPIGASPDESPRVKPAALLLSSAAADTTAPNFAARFEGHHVEVSATQNLDEKMPPVLMFHGDADTTVPYRFAVELHDKLVSTGNVCTLVTVPGGSHNFRTDLPEWKQKCEQQTKQFLIEHKILPADAN